MGFPNLQRVLQNKNDAGSPGEQLSIHRKPLGLVYVRYAGNPGSLANEICGGFGQGLYRTLKSWCSMLRRFLGLRAVSFSGSSLNQEPRVSN